jgi:hypothetical protein
VDGRLVRARPVQFDEGARDWVGAVKGERHLRVRADAEDAADVADEGLVPARAALDDDVVDLKKGAREKWKWGMTF